MLDNARNACYTVSCKGKKTKNVKPKGRKENKMKKYRIDLEEINVYCETLDNTDDLLTEAEMDEYFDELIANDARVNKEDYILRLVDNETNEEIIRI